MEKIDIQNFKKYYLNNDGNATLARVGHVNYVIDGLTQKIIEVINQEVVTRDYVFNLGLGAASSFNKVNNYSLTVQGQTFDVYSLQAFTQLSGSATYVIPIGYITTSSPGFNLGTNSSTVLANDSLFQDMITSLGVGALVTDADPMSINFGNVIPVDIMAINIDNTITTPDEYYIFLIAGSAVPFECNILIDIQAGAVEGSAVEYTVI
jgi:hypothetical protein